MKPQYKLIIQGFMFDVIDYSSRQFEEADLNPRVSVTATEHILVQIWRDICGHDVFDLLTDYETSVSSALVAFLDTCASICSDFTLSLAADGLDTDSWKKAYNNAAMNRRFALTAGGHYALCPHLVEEGDIVVVLMGQRTPFILRPRGDDYLLVGECYVHGIMQGQALSMLEKGEKTLRDFRIL
ncbi:heterokaryon incompatibility protein-domain-containing protein [Apiospora sp. TS-2023a]